MQKIEKHPQFLEDKKGYINYSEWQNKTKNIHIARDYMNKLIMNYLIIEGHKETA